MRAHVLSIPLCLLALTLLPACGGGGGGAGGAGGGLGPLPPSHDLVVFSTDPSGGGITHVLVADAAGGGVLNLTQGLFQAGSSIDDVAWSPDRTRVAIQAYESNSSDLGIYVADVAVGGIVKVSGDASVLGESHGFFWSPDSSRLAFTADPSGGPAHLYIAMADGSVLIDVALSPALGANGVSSNLWWSPDGSEIAFSADLLTPNIDEVFVCDRDGGSLRRISGPTPPADLGIGDQLRWSPDGLRVAFAGEGDTAGIIDAYVALASGVGGRLRLYALPLHPANVLRTPEWSADGARLAYIANQLAAGTLELFTSLANGTGNTRVSKAGIAGGNVASFRWSPVGQTLAYVADLDVDDEVNLYAVAGDGTAAKDVSGPMASLPQGGGIDLEWSPDATHIAYIAPQLLAGTEEVFLGTPTGPDVGVLFIPSLVGSGGEFFRIEWSPDAQQLATGTTAFSPVGTVVVAPLAGGLVILGDGSAGFVGWTPDGSHLVLLNGTQLEAAELGTPPLAVFAGPFATSILDEAIR